MSRRFKPPWTVTDIGAAFVVEDASGQRLALIYYEEEPGRRSAAKLLGRDEARRVSAGISQIPYNTLAKGDPASLRRLIAACEAEADSQGLEQIAYLLSMAKQEIGEI